ncbi:putative Zn(II)2Cys6 transcription factor [Fusarium venenatum]|uniref:putative Zn(II)2Cys6 transcription factor n=1 Tax=Fusarium venenatum TaxID=56646 RepID=UPI001D6B1FC8|nr:putative Zn(II)2Cys6 transcription factor [Fusarium venenatum]
MSTRKAHTKTRSGCIQCKQKHVKCDEARPSCGACTRWKVPCVFKVNPNRSRAKASTKVAVSSPNEVQNLSPSTVETRSPSTTVTPTAQPEPQRENMTMWEFELLHHYITKVTKSFLLPPFLQKFLSEDAVTQATQHDFLFHITIMTSCLHLALTKSPCFTQAHHDFILGGCSDAMAQFRKEAENIDESNWRAVRPFAFLMSIYTLSLPLLGDAPKSPEAILDEIIRVLNLLRGVKDFISLTEKMNVEYEESKANYEALRITSLSNSEEELSIEQIVANLVGQVRASEDDIHTRHENLKAIDGLRRASDLSFILSLRPIIWPCTVEPGFCALLEQRNSTAMVILAHYAVVLDQCKSLWWCADLGSQVIAAAKALLPNDVLGAIAYPLERIKMRQV